VPRIRVSRASPSPEPKGYPPVDRDAWPSNEGKPSVEKGDVCGLLAEGTMNRIHKIIARNADFLIWSDLSTFVVYAIPNCHYKIVVYLCAHNSPLNNNYIINNGV
jgi:hypothetical protein